MKSEEQKAQAEKKFDLAIDLLTLPLISRFKYLQFNGLADGTLLVPNFNVGDLVGRYFILKGVRIVPEYPPAAAIYQDFYVTDGITVNQELIPGNTRINRIFDESAIGTTLNLLFNGSSSDIFPQYAAIVPPLVGGNVPLDLDVDNIFYKYPEKIETLNVSVLSSIFQTLNVPATLAPNVKVFVQCYLL